MNMDNSSLTIETENLLIKSISLNFKDAIFSEFTPEIATYMSPRSPEKIEETIEFINFSINENKNGESFQAVVLDKDQNFLGCTGAVHLDTKTPSLGIWIKKSAHGHGYGKEAVMALKDWVANNCDCDYILYPVDKANIPSRKIPEFMGAKVAREYEDIAGNGNRLNLVEYHIYP